MHYNISIVMSLLQSRLVAEDRDTVHWYQRNANNSCLTYHWCVFICLVIYIGRRGRRMSGYRRPQQQASLCWVIRPESTQNPTSPPSKCTADTAMSGDGGGAVVTHGVGNGVGWVGCLHFGFTAVSLVMDSQSILCRLQMCRSSA